MKTQQELKDRIKEIGEEIRNLRRAHWDDKAYKQLMEKAEKIKEQIQKKTDKEIDKLRDEQRKLMEELEKKKLSRKIQLSKYLEDWLWQYMQGIDWGYKHPFIAWHSEDERFVILTHPEQTSGQGTAMCSMGYYYSSSAHYLIDTKLDSKGIQNTPEIKLGYKIGKYIYGDNEGRLTKEKKQILLDRLEEYKKENKIK